MTDAASLEACRNLIADYVACVDAQDYDGLRTLFTADAVFARPTDPDNPVQGIDAIVAAFASRPRTRLTQHLMAQTRLTPTGPDEIRGQSSLTLYTADAAEAPLPGKGRKATGPLMGIYDDRFVRTAAGWRFAARLGRVTLHT
jgi:ketosteroid isomerase-like protein